MNPVPAFSMSMTVLLSVQRAIFLATSCVLILSSLFLPPPSEPTVLIVLALLVGLVGLPHGALDPLVAYRVGIWRDWKGAFLFLSGYLGLAGLALGLWILIPSVSLIVFLLYSAFHFSGDWRHQVPLLYRLSAGLAIIACPALFHADETGRYFALLAGDAYSAEITASMMILAVPALVGLGLAIADRKTPLKCRLEFAFTALAALFLEPIPFFVLYFCTQHSPRHLIETSIGLPAKHLVPTAIAFTLLAIGMAALVYEVLPTVPKTDGIVQVVFVGLAILTVPHMLLVEAAAARASRSPSTSEATASR